MTKPLCCHCCWAAERGKLEWRALGFADDSGERQEEGSVLGRPEMKDFSPLRTLTGAGPEVLGSPYRKVTELYRDFSSPLISENGIKFVMRIK